MLWLAQGQARLVAFRAFHSGRVLLEPLPAAHGQKLGFRGYFYELQPPIVHQRANLRDAQSDEITQLFR